MAIQDFMKEAIALANENVKKGGEPFGAVIVKNGEIIGTGVNETTFTNDPTAHAELLAIRKAAKKLNSPDLEGCEVYASGEPCPMCLSAIYWANIKSVYFSEQAGPPSRFIYKEIGKPREDRSIEIKHLGMQ